MSDVDEQQFKPGSFGCHEAMHMAMFLQTAVEEQLCEHPAIELNPAWKKEARAAADALFTLYQAIGAKHGSDG